MKSDSVFMSYVLRHDPDAINLDMDKRGWVSIQQLIDNANVVNRKLNLDLIKKIVRENNKGRFAISEDGKFIRALQGHSLSKERVSIEFEEKVPPSILYHGTATKFMDSIKERGLISNNRQYVHLSSNEETAVNVGSRHGTPIILEINTQEMINDGHIFFLSENGVWLTDNVPVKYLAVKHEQNYKRSFSCFNA